MSLLQVFFLIIILIVFCYCLCNTQNKVCFVLVIFILVFFILMLLNTRQEDFITMDPNYYIYYDQLLPQFWDNKLRRTRNMSYDLRGDIDPDRPTWVPFHMSPLI